MTGTPRTYFEQMYSGDPDPWQFDTSWYEARKRDLLLAALPDPRYRFGYEPGCANGALTERLASRCERLLATDMVDSVVDRASARLAGTPHVDVRLQPIPDQWPSKQDFDLIVVSEIGYYFDPATLRAITAKATASLEAEGTLIAVHWRGATDYPLTAEETHRIIDTTPGLRKVAGYAESSFLLDVWVRQ